MSGKIIRLSARRISITQLQLVPELWLVACACGHQEKTQDREAARAARRRHQAAHRRHEAEHPAGKGRPPGGGGAA